MSIWSQLARFKPDFFPAWLFWLGLVLGGVLAGAIGLVGLWVLFTQIEFL